MQGQAIVSDLLGWRMPLRAPGDSGFRAPLVSYEQGADVYKHVLFMAGAVISGSPWGGLLTVWDAYQASFKPESRSEFHGDIAGAMVGAAIYAWGTSGDTATLHRRITGTLCE